MRIRADKKSGVFGLFSGGGGKGGLLDGGRSEDIAGEGANKGTAGAEGKERWT